MKADTLNRLRPNDRAMIRWISNVKAKDEISSDSLLTKHGIQDLDVVLRTGRKKMVWTCRAQHVGKRETLPSAFNMSRQSHTKYSDTSE